MLRSTVGRRIVSAVVACTVATACVSWHTEAPPAPGTQQQLGHVVVVPAGGSAVELKDAYIAGDSLIGMQQLPQYEHQYLPAVRVAFPVASISSMERGTTSPVKTGLFVLWTAAGAAVPFMW